MRTIWLSPLVALALTAPCLTSRAQAQDPFEIHVYNYEPIKLGQFTLEQHLNYWAMGSKRFDGTVAPTNDQLHMTYEITAGLSEKFSIGFMELNGLRPGGSGLEYAGWRVLPHFYAPESWHLPLDLGLVAEFSFVRSAYETDSQRVEIRPIAQKRLGKFEVIANPVFSRALHGPGTRDGWQFEPAVRVAYDDSDKMRIVPYLEWYSALGSLRNIAAPRDQVHQLYPGIDLKLNEHLLWSLGVGFGITPREPRLVFKSRVELAFGAR